jgi:hypothetical protein
VISLYRSNQRLLWLVCRPFCAYQAAVSSCLFTDSFCTYQAAVCSVLVQRLLQLPTVLLSRDRLMDFNGQSINTSSSEYRPKAEPGLIAY